MLSILGTMFMPYVFSVSSSPVSSSSSGLIVANLDVPPKSLLRKVGLGFFFLEEF